MGRSCIVCSRSDRDDLERRLVAGEPVAAVARSVDIARSSLRRHAEAHLPAELAGLRDAGKRISTARATDRLEDLYARARAVLEHAEAEGRHPIALQAVRELRGFVELIAKLSGELDSKPDVVVNITSSSEWVAVQTVILTALDPYPDARLAVAEALAPLGAA